MAKKSSTFHSSLSIASMAEASGKLSETRKALEHELTSLGIDPSTALNDLPSGVEGDREAVVRLISLARGNGRFVRLGNLDDKNPSLPVSIVLPASDGMLQAGHDQALGE